MGWKPLLSRLWWDGNHFCPVCDGLEATFVPAVLGWKPLLSRLWWAGSHFCPDCDGRWAGNHFCPVCDGLEATFVPQKYVWSIIQSQTNLVSNYPSTRLRNTLKILNPWSLNGSYFADIMDFDRDRFWLLWTFEKGLMVCQIFLSSIVIDSDHFCVYPSNRLETHDESRSICVCDVLHSYTQ